MEALKAETVLPADATAPAHDALAIGLDIESSDDLPWSGDPWSEPFYVENFTGAELAWCLGQPDSRLSLCGLWCAKEAARKCGQEFAGCRPIEVEILHDPQGRPMLRPPRAAQAGRASDWVLSISHAGRMGLAVCVKQSRASRAQESRAEAGSSPFRQPGPPDRGA